MLRNTPTAEAMLNEVTLAYPQLKKGFASAPFVTIYNRTVTYGRAQIDKAGSVSIYRLIEEWRRAIVQSKGGINTNVAAAPPAATQTPGTKIPSAKPPVETSSGSGIFVTQEGHLLTNAHVVSDCSAISVKTNDDGEAAARVLATNENDDLALLKIDKRAKSAAILRTGRPARTGESTVVFGFPLSSILASTGNATTGIITALAGPRDDPHLIQISAPVQPGNSGGPVLDTSGLLIGVVVSKLDALRVARAIDDVPQNVNFAIKVSTAANFLDARGIAYKSGAKELPIPDIVDQAKGFSVQILCR